MVALPNLLTHISLDPAGSTPLYCQIDEGLRTAILTGRLAPGLRLPSTRELAAELAVSRNTVRNAFDQLIAEGYLEAVVGAGTFVAKALPAFSASRPASIPGDPATGRLPQSSRRRVSGRGDVLAGVWRDVAGGPPRRKAGRNTFMVGSPALEAFPYGLWARIAARVFRQIGRRESGPEQHPAGYYPLREAIAHYLGAARAVRCSPDQVFIVSGSQMGMFLAGQVLLNQGDGAWVEDPGYIGGRSMVLFAGGRLVPVPIDSQGLRVKSGRERDLHARLAIVTPSHQYPTGSTMSLGRRMQLLAWAEEAGSWIMEDDYDSEFRYDGRPLPALQGLDRHQRVIYVGTFSKVLFPSLRLAYLVIPPDLMDAFLGAVIAIYQYPPLLNQAVVAAFMQAGHFMRHIRKMRRLYQQRRDALLEAMTEHIGDIARPGPVSCGMHITYHLPPHLPDVAITKKAYEQGLNIMPLSGMALEAENCNGLVMGFAGNNGGQIQAGVQTLAGIIQLFSPHHT